MDLTAIKGLRDLTRELIKQHKESTEPTTAPLFDQLWSVVEQELLRYSCSLSDDCRNALRELVSHGADAVGEPGFRGLARGRGVGERRVRAVGERKGRGIYDRLYGEQHEPEIVVTPNVYPLLGSQPVRYLIYGLHVHPNRKEELAEASLRTLVLSMITAAKEGESDELTLQTLGAVKARLCPWWPFWDPEDC